MVFLDLWYKGSAKEILIEKLKMSPKNLRGLDLEIEKLKNDGENKNLILKSAPREKS